MLTKIILKKLFSRFDYEINLNENGITILTGPNGYGKSTILKCIDSLYRKDINFFISLDFQQIMFVFENKSANITFAKTEDNQLKIGDIIIPNNYANASNIINSIYCDDQILFENRDRALAIANQRNYIYHLAKENIDLIKDYNNSDLMELTNHLPPYWLRNMNSSDKKMMVKIDKINEQLKKSSKSLGQLHFIKEQRLIQRKLNDLNKAEAINVIENIPTMMKKNINEISNNYSATANRLDSSYPERLFNTTTGITSEEYISKMEDMTEKFNKLNKYDISSMQSTQNVIFKDTHAIALKVYFEDFNEKYKVYEDFIQKLDLFTEIINNRLAFKEIRISSSDGLKVIDKGDDRVIELDSLSSGEKQEIVMFYDLIFAADQNAILLIDEPEISLHIVWQKMYMDDLLRVVEYKKMHAIVATHSPQIINNHWELQIDLGELYGS